MARQSQIKQQTAQPHPGLGVLPRKMKTTSGSNETETLDDLDTLLSHALRYAPPADFAERVMAALHEEDKAPLPPLPRPWYLTPYTWGSAAAACIMAAICLLYTLKEESHLLPADAVAVDDALLVDEALAAIDDPDLISAICSVSTSTCNAKASRTR